MAAEREMNQWLFYKKSENERLCYVGLVGKDKCGKGSGERLFMEETRNSYRSRNMTECLWLAPEPRT